MIPAPIVPEWLSRSVVSKLFAYPERHFSVVSALREPSSPSPSPHGSDVGRIPSPKRHSPAL